MSTDPAEKHMFTSVYSPLICGNKQEEEGNTNSRACKTNKARSNYRANSPRATYVKDENKRFIELIIMRDNTNEALVEENKGLNKLLTESALVITHLEKWNHSNRMRP